MQCAGRPRRPHVRRARTPCHAAMPCACKQACMQVAVHALACRQSADCNRLARRGPQQASKLIARANLRMLWTLHTALQDAPDREAAGRCPGLGRRCQQLWR